MVLDNTRVYVQQSAQEGLTGENDQALKVKEFAKVLLRCELRIEAKLS